MDDDLHGYWEAVVVYFVASPRSDVEEEEEEVDHLDDGDDGGGDAVVLAHEAVGGAYDEEVLHQYAFVVLVAAVEVLVAYDSMAHHCMMVA